MDDDPRAPWLEKARRGDLDALGHLLAICERDIRRYAYRHCRASDVDDAVQETLLIVTCKLRTLRALASFSGWLWRIVRRECRRLESRLFGLEPLDHEGPLLDERSDQGLRLDVARALQSLSAPDRDIVLRCDFEGRTVREIARALALTQAAAKSRLHRARERLREHLLHEGEAGTGHSALRSPR